MAKKQLDQAAERAKAAGMVEQANELRNRSRDLLAAARALYVKLRKERKTDLAVKLEKRKAKVEAIRKRRELRDLNTPPVERPKKAAAAARDKATKAARLAKAACKPKGPGKPKPSPKPKGKGKLALVPKASEAA